MLTLCYQVVKWGHMASCSTGDEGKVHKYGDTEHYILEFVLARLLYMKYI